MAKSRVIIPGSERLPIPGARPVSGAGKLPDPKKVIEVTITVRRKKKLPERLLISGGFSNKQLQSEYGADPADFKAIAAFAKKYNLKVVEKNAVALTIKLAGLLKDLEQAFGITLTNVRIDSVICHERTGPLTIPPELKGIVQGVFGLDNRPQANTKFRVAPKTALSFSPLEVARLYNFPPGTGKGQTVAIIELGGGFVPADLSTYFSGIGVPNPMVVALPVDGGTNQPTGDPNGPDGEVMLDIEIIGAIVPEAKIKVYFAPNTDKGFLDAINAAVHDPETPVAVSISWGGPEETWTAQSRIAFETVFQNAAALSVQVTCASGDGGSTDGTKAVTVDFPASAPHALGCGGTHLEGSASILKEVVWNSQGGGTGGGVSAFFTKPAYQSGINTPAAKPGGGRGVPDICGNAAVETGYKVRVDGKNLVIGGTSAVAPLWAGLIARLAQGLGKRVPFLHPILYSHPATLRDITSGNNDVGGGGGKYKATKGWDACTGLGSPNGTAILTLLKVKLSKKKVKLKNKPVNQYN